MLFTLEYLIRLYAARRFLRYASSFLGVVNLLTIVPLHRSRVGAAARPRTRPTPVFANVAGSGWESQKT